MIEEESKKENGIKSPLKYLFMFIGFICVVLGGIGIFLPILPTTPFMLLASFFFIRSSEKLHQKLLENKRFGETIYNFENHKAIKRKTRIRAISLMWVFMIISIIIVSIWWVKILFIGIAIGVTIYLMSLNEC